MATHRYNRFSITNISMRSRESFLVKKQFFHPKVLPQADELFGKITDAYIYELKAKKNIFKHRKNYRQGRKHDPRKFAREKIMTI